ncbi:putative short chain dehydrogenase [Plectosphaerella plurivora]|uniref:Short chain dehydrogenase n=1 Tax=Plectosphaerella plurivora TaxID=936078 RepID=A0A9P9A785_9PEZI|nr:putative short chain dehydrogenase [Plectosphaerella plurivora]
MARILITGSADGLGLASAKVLVANKHTVYLHARSAARAAEAKAACPGAAGVLVADLTSVAETRKLADEANAIGRFDAVIHNAGLMAGGFRKTADIGVPALVAVNVVAPYILACLLTPPARHIFISSTLHRQSNAESCSDIFWRTRGEAPWADFPAYCDSKLHVLLIANALARRQPDVCVSSVHPGWIATKLGGESAPDSIEDGVETYVMLAEGDYDTSLTGKFWDPKRKMVDPLPVAGDVDRQEEVVKACKELTGLELPSSSSKL